MADFRLCYSGADTLIFYSGLMFVALEDNGFDTKMIAVQGKWQRTHDLTHFYTYCNTGASVTIPADNINKIKIVSSVTKGMVKGTKFRLYKEGAWTGGA